MSLVTAHYEIHSELGFWATLILLVEFKQFFMDTGRQQGAQQCFVVLAGEVHSICTNATAAPFFSIHNVFTFFWQLGGKNGV